MPDSVRIASLPAAARFWWRVLMGVSIALALQGVSWVVIGSFDPFGFWDRLAARHLYAAESLPAEVVRFARLIMVPFGATDAAFFAMATLLLRRLPLVGRWPLELFVAGVAVWFVVDTAGCIALGAWFNVWLVNLPALALVGVPSWMLWRRMPRELGIRARSRP